MLITDLKNHLKWYGNSYVTKTVYMVGRDECIKIRFPSSYIKEVIEYVERLEADGFRVSCWAYWFCKKCYLWFRDKNKVAIQSKDGINVVITATNDQTEVDAKHPLKFFGKIVSVITTLFHGQKKSQKTDQG